MKKVITLCLVLCLALTGLLLPAAAGMPEAESVVRALGIMVGDQNGNMNLSQNVTRAQFAKMLAVAAGQDAGQTGYAPFRDVSHTHWAAGYIKTASDNGWFLGYVDGTFRPDNTILLEEAATAVLRMLGYSESDYPGAYPQAQLSKFAGLELDEDVRVGQGQRVTRQDCVYIFYNLMNAKNKQGQIHAAARGYALDASGKIDYQAMLLSEAKGPFVAQDALWMAGLPFDASAAEIYLNDRPATALVPAAYDVYYYNRDARVLWVYTEKVVGVYTASVSGSGGTVQSVTVAGASYAIGEAAAARKLSAMGQFVYGDAVALLMGMNGQVADVVPADSIDGLRYGVIVSAGMQTYASGGGSRTDYMITLAATDGKSYSYVCDNTYLDVGALVSAGYENGEAVVRRLSGKSLTGKVDSAGGKIGSQALAPNVEILEVTDGGRYAAVYATRLAGSTLERGDVRFYALDAQGRVSHLILGDVTGDRHDYAVLVSAAESVTEVPGSGNLTTTVYNGQYQYIVNGQSGSLRLTDRVLGIKGTGPARLVYSEGTLSDIKLLDSVALASVGASGVQSTKNQSYALAEDVQVYIKIGDAYHLSQLSAVTGGDYTLTGYYDSGFSAGGRVRVIVAKG